MANDQKQTEGEVEKVFFLLQERANSALTVAELLKILSGRGYPLLLILFSLPFCLPIPIPGLSTPFGIVIGFIGLRIAFNHRIWLPKFILNKTLSKKIIYQISSKGLWLIRKISKITANRWTFMSQKPIFHIINGLVIAILGFVLALPLPIPLSNLGAAWAILLMSIGLLEDDGVFIFLAYIVSILSVLTLAIFFYLITLLT